MAAPAKRRVLVTGASGLVGLAVAARLRDAGWAVRALCHAAAAPPADEEARGDVRDAAAMAAATASCDAVVHCAGLMASEGDAVESINADGARVVAQCARAAGVARFVLIGSAAIYRAGALRGAPESTEIAPRDRYTASKARAEEEVRRAFGDACCVLRPVSVYASRPNPFTEVLRQAVLGAEIPVLDEALPIDLVHADDLAQAAALGLDAHGTFNIAGEPAPWRALFECVGRALGAEPRFVPYTAAERARFHPLLAEAATAERTVSIAAARARLGYAPLHDWRDELPRGLA